MTTETPARRALPPSRVADQFMLRMPDGLRDKLKERAARNRRSMNQEIVLLVEQGLLAESAST